MELKFFAIKKMTNESFRTNENGEIETASGRIITEAEIDAKIEDVRAEFERKERFKRLERIFTQKTTGLKKLAIDKPWMTDPEAINDQYRVYEEMYKNAKAGYYDDATNQAIIQANESAKRALAPITILLNEVRSVIEMAIANDEPNADAMLDAAEAVSLSKEDITPEKIAEIKGVFGL